MDTLALIVLIVLYWAIFFVTTFITWVIYIKEPVKIEPWSYFDRYPFICNKCMTTWTLIAIYVMVALLLNNFIFGLFGVLLSGLHGYGLYKSEKERQDGNN